MVDSASNLECRHCKKLMSVEIFWEHVMSGLSCKFCPKSELEVIRDELMITKEELIKVKESCVENEASLKTEIKYLLAKLTKNDNNIKTFRSLSINNNGTIKTARTKSAIRIRKKGIENNNFPQSIIKTMEDNGCKKYKVERNCKKSRNPSRKEINLDNSDITEENISKDVNIQIGRAHV